MIFKRPMKAVALLPPKVEHTNENILAAMSKLRFPVWATLKKDGIRALRANKTLLSSQLKLIPNKSIRERSIVLPGGYDMELYNPELSYSEIESIVMSEVHPDSDKIQFHILDTFGVENATYEQRIWHIKQDIKCFTNCPFWFEEPSICNNAQELFEHFLRFESSGGEGICFRVPWGKYKQGRSTLNEQWLVKLARYERTELVIIGFKEQMENNSTPYMDERGYTHRDQNKNLQNGKNTLGAFTCVSTIAYKVGPTKDDFIDVGTGVGLTNELRKEIWDHQDRYLGKMITVKHKPVGAKNKLRHPVYCGFRNEIDL
jgi:hypothetical protein